MVKFNKICLILISCITCGCIYQVPYRVRKQFTQCYNPRTDYSKTSLRFNGYYILKTEPYLAIDSRGGNAGSRDADTAFNKLMFFPDGIFVLASSNSSRKFYDLNMLTRLNKKHDLDSELFYRTGNWGLFELIGDTLKMQRTNSNDRLNPYWVYGENWSTLSGDSLVYIHYKNYPQNVGRKAWLEFVETNTQLESNTWLKKEKWFWCNKSDFKEFIQAKPKN
jgi:hypothetical protein